MSKYRPLSERLSRHRGDEWRASFAEIEEVLGFPLPKSARAGRAWWSNDGEKSHARAWTGHGWDAHDVDPGQASVTFRRREAGVPARTEVAPPTEAPVEPPSKPLSPWRIGAMVAGGAAVVAGLAGLVLRGRRD